MVRRATNDNPRLYYVIPARPFESAHFKEQLGHLLSEAKIHGQPNVTQTLSQPSFSRRLTIRPKQHVYLNSAMKLALGPLLAQRTRDDFLRLGALSAAKVGSASHLP
jgi:hypothetical protein